MTPEMRESRLGKLTASKAAVIMGKLNTAGLADYISTLAFERVYGDTGEEGYQSRAMARGNELEPRALAWYAFERDCIVTPCPTCREHPDLPYVAATPDGIRSDRTIQAKCLLHKAWVHARTRNEVPSEYRWQCRWEQWVFGFRLCDFVVWHPKGGGFVIETSVTEGECAEMRERAMLVNGMVEKLAGDIRRWSAAD